jgi:hypothetical protein
LVERQNPFPRFLADQLCTVLGADLEIVLEQPDDRQVGSRATVRNR